ncbi:MULTISPECIES: DUF3679 domain-containing protein [Brevibacillus]|uniref:DUF3679 domain-containing protein n=1 Tax=Brevibacillus TaxID=55080 RepID=UPI0003FEFB3F|nr:MULTISPECIES: DUF3679 domain-containing protein [Brevibacillus]UYZ12274.1 YqxA family protein [Brevibacillus sp. WF146]
MNVTVKLAGMVVILLVGVALGLQTAERGIHKVSGTPEQQPQTFYIKKLDKGQMEIAVMGTQVQAAAPHEMVNYVSSAGQSLGRLVKDGAKSAVEWMAGMFAP